MGAESGVAGSPRSPASEPSFQESPGRRTGWSSVPSVWSWWGRLVSVGGRASGETACVYIRKRRPRFGAITAACEVKSTCPAPSAPAGCSASLSACSLEHRFYNNFLYQQNAVICLVTSNSGLVALPLRLWDLVHSGGDKHGYQVPTLVQGLSGCGAGKAWAFRLPRFAGGYQR